MGRESQNTCHQGTIEPIASISEKKITGGQQMKYRFPYFVFDSKIREKYDFEERSEYESEDAHSELLERRAALMRKYLENYRKNLACGL